MKTPYLIQRVIERKEVRTPREGFVSGFDDYFECDYMGSAEFEFGALPTSLKAFTKQKELSTIKFKSITNSKDEQLYVVSPERNELLTLYFEKYIPGLIDRSIHLKESSHLSQHIKGEKLEYFKTVIWWDIGNNVMFTFGKRRKDKLLKAIQGTRLNKIKQKNTEWY